MIKVIINGCNGKMGKVLIKLLNAEKNMEIVAGIDKEAKKYNHLFPIFTDISLCKEEADVLIDFSHHSALPHLIEHCVKAKIPLVTATTGLDEEIFKKLLDASHIIPIFQTGNMSLGINVLTDLAKKAAQALGNTFDIEIIEKHHNQKVDAPSGTAYLIADGINEVFENKKNFVYGRYGKAEIRQNADIGIHAIRGGTIAGEHTIIFAGSDEIIEIKHTALSKDIFAIGAIKAAKFLVQQKNGLYHMNDIL